MKSLLRFNLLLIFLIGFISTAYAKELKVVKFEEATSIEGRVKAKTDKNGDPTALLIVSLPVKNVKFEHGVVEQEFNVSEYLVYLLGKTRRIKILAPGFDPLVINFKDFDLKGGVEPRVTYNLVLKVDDKLDFSKHNQFYIDVFFQAGQNMGVGGSIGAYYHAINAEVEFAKGLSKSDKIYWYDKAELIGSSIYSSWFGNVKFGYGFQFKQRYQVTPQLGVGILKCTSSTDVDPAKDANSVYGLLGVRGNFTFAKHFQVTLAPYYNFPIKKSSSFIEISKLQTTIDHWTNGFNVKIGFTAFF